MTMIRKLIAAEINDLGDDEVEVVMSTSALARDGHILVTQGCRLDNYRANPIVLWSHDSNVPVGNAEDVVIDQDKITARVRFAPLGISARADEIRGLTKAGVIRAVSVGFDPLSGEPLDPKRPKGGQRFTDWDLMELSFCSIPIDTSALVTARAIGEMTVPDTPQSDRAAPRQSHPCQQSRRASDLPARPLRCRQPDQRFHVARMAGRSREIRSRDRR
jgi:HK97 family phage prohead protease